MKLKKLLLSTAFAVASTLGFAQGGGQFTSGQTFNLTYGSSAPAGNCGVNSLYVNTSNADFYDCNSSSSPGVWNQITGGAGATVKVNGASVVGANFNNTTPAAQTNFQNCTYQVSGSSVSVECPTNPAGPNPFIDPTNPTYGAIGDAQKNTSGSTVTSGTTTLSRVSSVSPAFSTTLDAGKDIVVSAVGTTKPTLGAQTFGGGGSLLSGATYWIGETAVADNKSSVAPDITSESPVAYGSPLTGHTDYTSAAPTLPGSANAYLVYAADQAVVSGVTATLGGANGLDNSANIYCFTSNGGGTGAIVQFTTDGSGHSLTLQLLANGKGYTSAPTSWSCTNTIGSIPAITATITPLLSMQDPVKACSATDGQATTPFSVTGGTVSVASGTPYTVTGTGTNFVNTGDLLVGANLWVHPASGTTWVNEGTVASVTGTTGLTLTAGTTVVNNVAYVITWGACTAASTVDLTSLTYGGPLPPVETSWKTTIASVTNTNSVVLTDAVPADTPSSATASTANPSCFANEYPSTNNGGNAWAGTLTYTTTGAHGASVGQYATIPANTCPITGATGLLTNQLIIAVPSSTTFTINAPSGVAAAAATGTQTGNTINFQVKYGWGTDNSQALASAVATLAANAPAQVGVGGKIQFPNIIVGSTTNPTGYFYGRGPSVLSISKPLNGTIVSGCGSGAQNPSGIPEYNFSRAPCGIATLGRQYGLRFGGLGAGMQNQGDKWNDLFAYDYTHVGYSGFANQADFLAKSTSQNLVVNNISAADFSSGSCIELFFLQQSQLYQTSCMGAAIGIDSADNLSDVTFNQGRLTGTGTNFNDFYFGGTYSAGSYAFPAQNFGIWIRNNPLSTSTGNNRFWGIDIVDNMIAAYSQDVQNVTFDKFKLENINFRSLGGTVASATNYGPACSGGTLMSCGGLGWVFAEVTSGRSQSDIVDHGVSTRTAECTDVTSASGPEVLSPNCSLQITGQGTNKETRLQYINDATSTTSPEDAIFANTGFPNGPGNKLTGFLTPSQPDAAANNAGAPVFNCLKSDFHRESSNTNVTPGAPTNCQDMQKFTVEITATAAITVAFSNSIFSPSITQTAANNQVCTSVWHYNATAAKLYLDDNGGCNGISLDDIAAAAAATTYANGDNPIIFNAASTTASRVSNTFGETTASTSTGTPYNTRITTAAGSTATPLKVDNSLTGSQTIPTISILPTWNTTGVATSFLHNLTCTAAGALSKQFDFQLGGTSEFNLTYTGANCANPQFIFAAGSQSNPSVQWNGMASGTGLYSPANTTLCYNTSGNIQACLLSTGVEVNDGKVLSISQTASANGTPGAAVSVIGTGTTESLALGTGTAGSVAALYKGANGQAVTGNVGLSSGSFTNLVSWTLPNAAATWEYHCDIVYTGNSSAGTPPSLVLGINANQSPTIEYGQALIYINNTGAASTSTLGSASFSAPAGNTDETILTGGTPAANGTAYQARISGAITASATSGTFAIRGEFSGGTNTPTMNVNFASCVLE